MGNQLYAVLLGGKIKADALMEDHKLVFVVAADEKIARKKAKKKWQAQDIHVDGTQRIEMIDGYKIVLEDVSARNPKDVLDSNNNYSK